MGKAIKRVGLGLATGGISELAGGPDGLKNILLGKKRGGFSADAIGGQIRAAQAQGIASAQKGLGELNTALDKDVSGAIQGAAAREQKTVITAAQDARRRAQQMIAQRGLQGSSLGLSQDRSITQNLGEQSAAIQGSIPERIRQMQLQNASARLSAGQGLFGGLGGSSGIRFQGQAGSRSGGVLGFASALAPIAGTIAGGAFGGPAGANIGGQLGSGIGSALNYKPSSNQGYA